MPVCIPPSPNPYGGLGFCSIIKASTVGYTYKLSGGCPLLLYFITIFTPLHMEWQENNLNQSCSKLYNFNSFCLHTLLSYTDAFYSLPLIFYFTFNYSNSNVYSFLIFQGLQSISLVHNQILP